MRAIYDLKWAESSWSALAVHEWSGPLQFLWGVDGAIPRALRCMCRQPINCNRPFLVLVKAFGTGKWPIGSWYSVRHYGGRHCRGYVVLWRLRTSRFKKTWEVSLSHTEDSRHRLYVERAKNTSAPLSQDGRSCLQASAIEKRFEKRIYTFRNPQKMKDKNAFFFRSEFRAFIVVMTFVAVSDTIGRIRLRLIELLVRDMMMPFWALLFVKNSMAGVWIREY